MACNLNNIDRFTLVAILTRKGYGCVLDEPTEALRAAVRLDRLRGDITVEEILAIQAECADVVQGEQTGSLQARTQSEASAVMQRLASVREFDQGGKALLSVAE